MILHSKIKKVLIELYHEIDGNCITNTDTVKMSEIQKILIEKYDVDEDSL